MSSAPESAAVAKHGVRAAGDYAEAERVDVDGLPLVGAAVWPGQSYCTTINKTNGEHGLSLLRTDGRSDHVHTLQMRAQRSLFPGA